MIRFADPRVIRFADPHVIRFGDPIRIQYAGPLHFDSDDVLSMLRTVQAVVTHLEGFPVERATKACLRATHYGSRSYATIKNILRQGLDLAPLPASTPAAPSLTSPRFARPIGELWHTKEASDELH